MANGMTKNSSPSPTPTSLTPPSPPGFAGGELEKRAERARQGSRRRRDREALAALSASRHAPPAGVCPDKDARESWVAAKAAIRQRIPAHAYETWIEPARLLGAHEGRVVVVASPRVADWLRRRYEDALAAAMGRELLVCEEER